MKKISLYWLFFVLYGMSYGQTITIRDQETNETLELVYLISIHPRAFALTNSAGQTEISAFEDAEEIEIRSLGYKTIITSYADLASSSFQIFMDASNLNLDEVVISATRWRQMSHDVPAKIISISSKDVALQNPQTAADLLSISGKVYIQKSQQGGGSPMIRGFASNRLLYTVDGISINTAIFRGGNIQNVINLDPFAIEKTEVLFGPGSLIYGSDAIGGVMSFQTLTPQLSLSKKPFITGKAISRYSSSNHEKTIHFDLNVGWKKWGLVTSLSSWDYDHLRQGDHGPDDYLKPYYVQRIDGVDQVVTQDDPLLQIPSAYRQMNIMQKLRFKPNDQWEFNYGFHFSETSAYGRYDRHNQVRNGTARYAEWNYGPQKWMMNNLNISHESDIALYDQLTIRLALQSFEESRIDRSLNSHERNTQTETVGVFSINADFVKHIRDNNNLYYGIGYVSNEVKSYGMLTDIDSGLDNPGPARYPQSTWKSLAFYLNDQMIISDKLTLQAGMRYNQFKLDAIFDTSFYPFPFATANLDNGALTGSIGAVYHPGDSWVVAFNAGTAFRSPNVDDIGKVFDSEPGSVVIPNPDLDAEYAYNFDISLAKVFGKILKVDVTGFYTKLRNALVRRNFTLNGEDSILYYGELSQVQAIQNAAVANVHGIQAGLEIKLPAGFSFSSDINWQVGKEELDEGSTSPSRHAAPLFGVSRLTFSANKLTAQCYAAYQAARQFEDLPREEQGKTEIYAADVAGNPYSPSWYTLNFKSIYQFTEHFFASAGIENLTDQRYRPYSSGISASGRNFIISLRANL